MTDGRGRSLLAYNGKFGPWRSLASALAWGARGPEFKSRRPDQIPQRLTGTNPPWTSGLASNWSPNVDASGGCQEYSQETAQNSQHPSPPQKTDIPDIFGLSN